MASNNDNIDADALRKRWAPFAIARDMVDQTPDMIEQPTDAQRAARQLEQQMSISISQGEPSSSNSVVRSNSNSTAAGAASAIGSRVDRMSVCRKCNGQGIVKHVYNHMVQDRTCSDCDGDGVIEWKPEAATSTSTAATEGNGQLAGAGDLASVADVCRSTGIGTAAGDEPPALEHAR